MASTEQPLICENTFGISADIAVSGSATALSASGAVSGTGRTAETGADSLDVIATADAFAVC